MSEEKTQDINQVMKARLEKLSQIKEKNVNPFTYNYDREHYAKDIIEKFDQFENKEVSVAGRIMA